MFKKLILLAILPVTGFAAPQWDIDVVDRAAPGNRVVQLLLRPNGSQHVVYTGCSDTQCNNSELFYADRSNINSSWQTTMIDGSGKDTGWFPSLSFDELGLPHVFYANHDKQKLLYATADSAGKWKTEKIGSGRGGWWTSSVASGGKVFVAHTKLPKSGWENAALELGTLVNGQWTFETIDAARNAGWFTSSAIMPDGNPVISYNAVFDQPVGSIKVAYKKNNKWQIIDIDGISIKHHVTVDNQGFVHVIYQKTSSSIIEYRVNGEKCRPPKPLQMKVIERKSDIVDVPAGKFACALTKYKYADTDNWADVWTNKNQIPITGYAKAHSIQYGVEISTELTSFKM